MNEIKLQLTDEDKQRAIDMLSNAEMDTVNEVMAAFYRRLRHQISPPVYRPFRVEVSRVVRVRQVAVWEGEAEDGDDASQMAEEASENGNLNWLDDDMDIPEPDDQSYEFEAFDKATEEAETKP